MVLLIPMMLVTSSLERYTALTLGVPGPNDELPPELPGRVRALRVARVASGYLVQAEVENTDVGGGGTEQRELPAADLPALQAVLATLKSLDPTRDRITLAPAPETSTDEVVRWMDAVRAGPSGELFPKVILESGG